MNLSIIMKYLADYFSLITDRDGKVIIKLGKLQHQKQEFMSELREVQSRLNRILDANLYTRVEEQKGQIEEKLGAVELRLKKYEELRGIINDSNSLFTTLNDLLPDLKVGVSIGF